MIADAIRQQCDTYRADAEYDLMMHGHHHPHHHHQQHHQLRDDGMRLELPMAVEPPFPVVYGGLHDKDARVVVKLDVHLGHFHLRDAFEWPIYPHVPAPSPEEFAKNLTADLGVGGEFAPLISHSIREQVLEARAREAYAPSVRKQVVRPYDVDEYGATLREVSDAEMEKLEREREREARKNRRSQRASLRSTRNFTQRFHPIRPLQSHWLLSSRLFPACLHTLPQLRPHRRRT
ncbi:hypothetical protein BC829DRAFT_31951 [Chytridium lagenaria]|nr:hypothetical protein BC829DRAFT_31951 [Chytridium lagenaria]